MTDNLPTDDAASPEADASMIANVLETEYWKTDPISDHAQTQMLNAGMALMLHYDLSRIANALETLAATVTNTRTPPENAVAITGSIHTESWE